MGYTENPLIGKRVVGVDLATDKKAIRFRLHDSEAIVARTDGDCCSETWIESLDAPEVLIGVVRSVEDLDLPEADWGDCETNGDGDVIAFYGCKITTSSGMCVLDYRNASNGYYGGELVWPGGSFYGGVYGQNVSTEEWRTIAGDSPDA